MSITSKTCRWRDVAPYKQHFCWDFLLCRLLRDGPAPTTTHPNSWTFSSCPAYDQSFLFSKSQLWELHISPITTGPSSIWLHPTIFLLMLFLRAYIITNGLSNMCLIMAQAASDNGAITSIWWVPWESITPPWTVTKEQVAGEWGLPEEHVIKAAFMRHINGGQRQGYCLIYEGKTLDHNDGTRMGRIIKSFLWFRKD